MTRGHPWVGRSSGGFTLIELILAMAIFSFIAMILYGAFFTGQRAVIRGEHSADLNQRLRVADDILGKQIRSTVFYYARNEKDDETSPFFLGKSDRMTFVTASPQGRGGTGLAVVTYRLTDGQLMLEERVGFTADDLFEPPRDAAIEEAVLLPDVRGLHFEYIGHEDSDQSWQSNWDSREEDALPAAVRMSIDDLEFFSLHPWVHDIPLMTVAYGWGDDFQEPPDEDEDDEHGTASTTDDEDNEGDEEDEE